MFTASPLQGNQLGVFPDGRDLDGALMQRTARELNLSETVFFLPSERACDARVRIFTPVGELPFAGHPVLGSAFVLGDLTGAATVSLETGLGPVPVELASEAEVAALGPDQRALAGLQIGVSCFAGHGASWKTRMFAPFHGVPEDPATGSAAGPLAVHLARHGRIAFGEEIEIRQGEEIGRPSVLYARAEGTADRIERVLVGGSAVIVARGEYLLG